MLSKLTYLQPTHDSAKSFYNKAALYPDEEANEIQLLSYNIKVATYNTITGILRVNETGIASQTTLRHVKEFIAQFKCDTVSLQQIKDKYLIDGRL